MIRLNQLAYSRLLSCRRD